MAGAGELLSGERVVVFLFVSRVLASAPFSLAAEASALLLLALAALALEISAEASPAPLRRFNTRPGASSGILLGAITLPTVMMSRLIQSTRALSSHEIELEVFASTSMQYWAASACCFGVLIFFHSILQRSLNYTSFRLGTYQVSKCSLLCVVFYVFACYLSSAKSYSVWHISLKMLWFLCHGLVSVTLIQHILHTFPSCSSIGEALLASSGLVLYFCDMLAHALSKIEYPVVSSKSIFSESGTRSEMSMIMQGLLLGLLLFPIFYKFALRVWMHFKKKPENPENEDSTYSWIGSSIFFYICLLVMMTVIVPAWMHFVLDFDVHPLIWVFKFVFTKPLERLALCVYWVLVISASVLRFYKISKHSKIERILLRKYYHLVAVLIFVPALLFQPEFLDLAFGAALGAFLILEMVRIWKIWPLGHIIHQFMSAFTDHRDSEILIISHFSLLMGCALPKWLSSEFNDRPLAPYAGILSLGIGDTMASMVGYKYGVLRWSKTGKKTIEGTAAGITSVLAACSLLLPLLASTGYIISQHWLSLLTAVTISGLLEAYTAQLDNAFIPLVFYSLLCL